MVDKFRVNAHQGTQIHARVIGRCPLKEINSGTILVAVQDEADTAKLRKCPGPGHCVALGPPNRWTKDVLIEGPNSFQEGGTVLSAILL
jgi:hypothetical protein